MANGRPAAMVNRRQCYWLNLDLSKPFITVIPDNKLEDTEYLKEKIEENRKVSLGMRKEIREYCFTNFDWSSIIKQYKEIINSI